MSEPVHRISVSLPESVYQQLEELVTAQGFDSRSQAIAEMINQSVIEHSEEKGSEIMAGTITLFYDESKGTILRELAQIERGHLNEVISSHHILLEENHTMEVLTVQGPARTLKELTNKLRTCKGVKTGRLTLTTTLIPPVHPLPA